MSIQRGSTISRAGAHGTDVRGRVWRGMREREIKNGGLRAEGVVVVLRPHSSRSNCFLLNLVGSVVSCSAGGGQEQQGRDGYS